MEPHITKEQILHFHNQTMNETETLSFLSHIGSCAHCAELFANSFSQTQRIPAPANLKERILSNAALKRSDAPPLPIGISYFFTASEFARPYAVLCL